MAERALDCIEMRHRRTATAGTFARRGVDLCIVEQNDDAPAGHADADALQELDRLSATLSTTTPRAERLQQSQFLPGIEWLQPATVADALGQQLSAGGSGNSGREPAPGLHGTGIDSVEVGDQTLDAGSANRIAYGPDTEFNVNFTNQGENDEVDIDVILKIEGGPKPIRVTKNVPSVAAGAQATATLGLDSPPPFDTAVTISVEVKAVPGEQKTDNNKADYDALFSQQ